MTKKKNTYPPAGPYSDPDDRYEVRYTQKCGPDGNIEHIKQKFTNKKKAIKCLNMLKGFEKSHEKGIVSVEEMDWGLMYFIVERVSGLYYITYSVEKIK